MKRVLLAKLHQSEAFREALARTGTKVLLETSTKDLHFGCGAKAIEAR